MIRICCLSSSLTVNSLTWNPDISLLMIIQIRHSETSQGPSANGDQTTDRYPAIAPNNGYISTEKILPPAPLADQQDLRTYGLLYDKYFRNRYIRKADRPVQCLVLCCERQIGHMGKRTRFWRLPYLETIGRESVGKLFPAMFVQQQ